MLVLRHVSLFAAIAIVSLCAVAITQAQTETDSVNAATTTATDTQGVADDVPEVMPVIDEQVSGQTEQGVRAALPTRTQERITKLAANISNRHDALVMRFENISGRLESRIAKLNQTGVDTTAALAALGSAKISTGKAKALMTDIDTKVYHAVTSESPRTAWPPVRNLLLEIRTELLAAHEALRESVTALKTATLVTEGASGVLEAGTEGASSEGTPQVIEN